MKVDLNQSESSQKAIRITTATLLKRHANHAVAPLLLAVLQMILRVQQRQERKAAKHQAWLDGIEKHRPEVVKANLHYLPTPVKLKRGRVDKWLPKYVTRAGSRLSPRTKK